MDNFWANFKISLLLKNLILMKSSLKKLKGKKTCNNSKYAAHI